MAPDETRKNTKRALVFAGAGASYAVDSSSFPTTAGFFDQLAPKIKNHPLIGALTTNFEQKFGDGTPDVEKVLWCLEEIISHLETVVDQKSPLGWLVPNNALQSLIKIAQPVNHYAAAANEALPKLRALKDSINASLYDCYSSVPKKNQLEANWLPLLHGLNKRGYWIDLVTTNYDLVIEEAARNSGLDIGNGRSDSVIPDLDTEIWRSSVHEPQADPPYKDGLITKLHGSLNWERGRNGRVDLGGTTYKSSHEHHVVIYPGFKGVPTTEPFATFHDYFEGAVRNAHTVIFLGFAFRDDYINTILKRSGDSQVIFSINPADNIVPGDEARKFHYLKSGFDSKSVEEVLSNLKPA